MLVSLSFIKGPTISVFFLFLRDTVKHIQLFWKFHPFSYHLHLYTLSERMRHYLGIYLCIKNKNVLFYNFHSKKDFAFFTIEKSPFFLKEINKFIFIYAFNIFFSIFNYIRVQEM